MALGRAVTEVNDVDVFTLSPPTPHLHTLSPPPSLTLSSVLTCSSHTANHHPHSRHHCRNLILHTHTLPPPPGTCRPTITLCLRRTRKSHKYFGHRLMRTHPTHAISRPNSHFTMWGQNERTTPDVETLEQRVQSTRAPPALHTVITLKCNGTQHHRAHPTLYPSLTPYLHLCCQADQHPMQEVESKARHQPPVLAPSATPSSG